MYNAQSREDLHINSID